MDTTVQTTTRIENVAIESPPLRNTVAATSVSYKENDSLPPGETTKNPKPVITYKARAPKDYGIVKAKEVEKQKEKQKEKEKEAPKKKMEAAKKKGDPKDK